MTRIILAAGLALLGTGSPVQAEQIAFSVHSVEGGERQLLAEGTRTYDPSKDIVGRKGQTRSGSVLLEKAVELANDWFLSIRFGEEAPVNGIGLFVEGPEGERGFSWEWFDRQEGDVFLKLQGTGQIVVETSYGPKGLDIRVELLSDMVLRYLDDMSKPPGTYTHVVVVKKGSVFRAAP